MFDGERCPAAITTCREIARWETVAKPKVVTELFCRKVRAVEGFWMYREPLPSVLGAVQLATLGGRDFIRQLFPERGCMCGALRQGQLSADLRCPNLVGISIED